MQPCSIFDEKNSEPEDFFSAHHLLSINELYLEFLILLVSLSDMFRGNITPRFVNMNFVSPQQFVGYMGNIYSYSLFSFCTSGF